MTLQKYCESLGIFLNKFNNDEMKNWFFFLFCLWVGSNCCGQELFLTNNNKVVLKCYNEFGTRIKEIKWYQLSKKINFSDTTFYSVDSNLFRDSTSIAFFDRKIILDKNNSAFNPSHWQYIFLDLNTNVGDVYYNGTLKLNDKSYDRNLKDTLYTVSTIPLPHEISHTCYYERYGLSLKYGIVFLEMHCNYKDDYYCKIRQFKYMDK